MLFNLAFQDPLFFLAYVVAIFFVLTIHEFSHAFVATLAGDPTARDNGRLTFNPFAHIDILGLIMLFLVSFGWGKPVPINPDNFRHPRRDIFFVSLAGPLSNFLSGIFFIIVLKVLVSYVNLSSANLLINFLFVLIIISFSLFIFNLIPLPPLDGSKLLFSLLPDKYINFKYNLSRYGPWILLSLIFLDNALNIGIFSYLYHNFLFLISSIID